MLQTQMMEVIKRLDKIDKKLDDQNVSLVPRAEFDAFKKSVKINYVLIILVTAAITALVYNFVGSKIR